VWRLFAAALGLRCVVLGTIPPVGQPCVWVSNHFNWFDVPVLQGAAGGVRCPLHAVVKADLADESSLVGRVLHTWSKNLGFIFYTRGDKRSGATVRSKIAGFRGAILVFIEGTAQAYGPPMLDKIRGGSFEAAFDSGKLVQPAVIYYNSRIGLGWAEDGERNGLRQTARICAKPTIAVVQLCTPLAPGDFASAEALGQRVKQVMADTYAQLEKQYKDWPLQAAAGVK
jgi:1-acyl-sn-glycerol-3-phosphate acyltransferase